MRSKTETWSGSRARRCTLQLQQINLCTQHSPSFLQTYNDSPSEAASLQYASHHASTCSVACADVEYNFFFLFSPCTQIILSLQLVMLHQPHWQQQSFTANLATSAVGSDSSRCIQFVHCCYSSILLLDHISQT